MKKRKVLGLLLISLVLSLCGCSFGTVQKLTDIEADVEGRKVILNCEVESVHENLSYDLTYDIVTLTERSSDMEYVEFISEERAYNEIEWMKKNPYASIFQEDDKIIHILFDIDSKGPSTKNSHCDEVVFENLGDGIFAKHMKAFDFRQFAPDEGDEYDNMKIEIVNIEE